VFVGAGPSASPDGIKPAAESGGVDSSAMARGRDRGVLCAQRMSLRQQQMSLLTETFAPLHRDIRCKAVTSSLRPTCTAVVVPVTRWRTSSRSARPKRAAVVVMATSLRSGAGHLRLPVQGLVRSVHRRLGRRLCLQLAEAELHQLCRGARMEVLRLAICGPNSHVGSESLRRRGRSSRVCERTSDRSSLGPSGVRRLCQLVELCQLEEAELHQLCRGARKLRLLRGGLRLEAGHLHRLAQRF
jgi:hypothetical protein